MSETASAPQAPSVNKYSRLSLFLRNDFVLRRIHSLTGLVPLTLFLCEHLYTNARSTQGADSFNGAVKFMTGLPLFMLIEWFGIYIPLAIHLILGIWIARTARLNVDKYNFVGNYRYVLQRLSGIFIILFLVVHLGHWRYGIRYDYAPPGETKTALFTARHYTPFMPGEKEFPKEYEEEYKRAFAKDNPGMATAVDPALGNAHAEAIAAYAKQDNMFLAMETAFQHWGWFLFYVIGLAAACYHTGNGVWTFLITWGLVRNAAAQKRMSTLCLGLGAALFLLGVFSLAGFMWGDQIRHLLDTIGFHRVQA